MDKTSIGDRMKTNYENISRYYLVRRMPVIIRIDGKAFHTFTRGFKKPFDNILIGAMQKTMKYLCENIQGCVFGYTQSDEISLLLVDYQTLDTCAWFSNNVQKICSVSASMATMAFNKTLAELVTKQTFDNVEYQNKLQRKLYGAMFDSRVFNIPKEEVCNYFVWRQQDATRNSIQSVGQANFSHKELDCKNCGQIQDMLFEKMGINWDDLKINLKRGSCCLKDPDWYIDREIPIFSDDRDYIERTTYMEE